MYKEPFASKETNAVAALHVEQKMEQVVAKVADQGQSDADFTANLLDLCTLNRMAESHQANAHALAEERSDDSQQRVVGGKVDR